MWPFNRRKVQSEKVLRRWHVAPVGSKRDDRFSRWDVAKSYFKSVLLSIPVILIFLIVGAEVYETFRPRTFVISDTELPEDLIKKGYSSKLVSDLIMSNLLIDKFNSENTDYITLQVGDAQLREENGEYFNEFVNVPLTPPLSRLDFRLRRKTLLDAKLPFTDLSLQSVISSVIDNFDISIYQVYVSIVEVDGSYNAYVTAKFGRNQSTLFVNNARIKQIEGLSIIRNIGNEEDDLLKNKNEKLASIDAIIPAVAFEIAKLAYPHALGSDLARSEPQELTYSLARLNSDQVFHDSVQYFLILCSAELLSNASGGDACAALKRFPQDKRTYALLTLSTYLAGDVDEANKYLATVDDENNKHFLQRLISGKSKFMLADGTYVERTATNVP